MAHGHYKTSTSEPDKALLRAIADGPVVAAAWRGPTSSPPSRRWWAPPSRRALPGTIRGDLALSAEELLVECAADAAHAAALCALWFTAAELAAAPAGAAAPAAPPKPDAGVAAAAAAKPSKRAAPAAAGERFYVTTAINYANGAPHMGHAYEGITSDVVARYHKAYSREVFFLTGADEHGQKIADTAAAAGVEPIALVDKHVAQFQELNLAVENTRCVRRRAIFGRNSGGRNSAQFSLTRRRRRTRRYVRTTASWHKALCQKIWQRAVDNGEVYLGTYSGWYNVREETFVTETDAAASDFKDPASGEPLKWMEEPSYFFRMGKFQQQILDHIAAHPEFVMPDVRRNEVIARLQKESLRDLSVSRTTFSWGIAVPGNPDHVMYVWFDALTNYLSGIDYPDGANARFWPATST